MRRLSFIIYHLSFSVALLVSVALVAFTACSSSEDSIADAPTPSTPDAPKTYNMTVTASKGDDATTRALTPDGNALNATWAAGEEVKVFKVTVENPGTSSEMESITLVGTLTAQSSGATTTLSGPFDEGYTPAEGDVLRLKFNPDPDYSDQEGTLDYIATHCDYALAEISIASVDASGNVTASGTAEFENQQAIVKFSLKEPDGTTPLAVTSLTVKAGSKTYNVTPTTAASDIYVAVTKATNRAVQLTAISADADSYTYSKSGVTFTQGQYYAIGVKMTADHPYTTTIDLSTLSDDYTVPDYTILTGTLSGGHKISIADGATVKLKDVTIPGGGNLDDSTPWAGITCLGNATIRLSGTNSVKGYNRYYSGIQPGDAGTTLTIEGSGTLTATNGGGDYDMFGAGIGGGKGQEVGNIEIKGGEITANGAGSGIGCGKYGICGNITISGGTISATSSNSCAGIGSGTGEKDTPSHCGNITISGGKVTARGGEKGAGIGSGFGTAGYSYCGNITITGGTITATGGSRLQSSIYAYGAGIGGGSNGKCGDITISGTATGTATGGTGCTYDIGPGYNGPCGTVSVASGTISGSHP